MVARDAIAHEIQTLDPKTDCQRIIYLLRSYEHPWLIQKSLEFALFRTYAIPSISQLLQATQQFQRHGQKRYDDTSLLIATIAEQGYDSEYGQQAIARMNYWHRKYAIANEDFLYVLSVFIYEPVRWVNRFGKRPMTQTEQNAIYHFWAEVGRRMEIQNIPPSYEAFEQFNLEYERDNFVYAESNAVIGEATIQIFLNWYPAWMRPAVRQVIYAILDEPLRQAFGCPVAHPIFRWLVPNLLKIRQSIVRKLPPRRDPYHFTALPNRTYPQGYQLDKLGPDHPVELS